MNSLSRHVHIVDDDAGVRRSTALLLRTCGFTAEQWVSGTDFLDRLADARTGCVLLDIRMPGIDGMAVLFELKRRGVPMPVVMLTGHGDINAAIRAMKAGASDFLEKPVERTMLIAALDEAFEKLSGLRYRADRTATAVAALAILTEREREVLRGLAEGLSNKGIALRLGISPRTVEIHRANVLRKLEVSSLAQALRIAFRAGLVDTTD